MGFEIGELGFEIGEIVLHRLTKEKLVLVAFTNVYEGASFKLRRFNTKTSTYEDVYCYEEELERIPEVIKNGEEIQKEDSESCAENAQVKK
jgi:hypothetical protein